MADYLLKCTHPDCGATFEPKGDFRTHCDKELSGEHGPALLEPVFEKAQIDIRPDIPGIFQFADWLPSGAHYLQEGSVPLGKPFCYKSYALASRLGLKHLYIAFSGFWPERGANLVTRTFKEFEAQAHLARYLTEFKDTGAPVPIISSAGNTANAFNLLSHALDLPLVLIVPPTGLKNLVLPIETNPTVVVVDGDYSDAIQLADLVAQEMDSVRDGGVFNVARRAGMGTVMLNAVAHPEQGSGRIFDHYFQAVGSASGALGAWGAAKLLRKDGRFGDKMPHVHMAQNVPFTPIADLWEAENGGPPARDLIADAEMARRDIGSVTATVLTNRKPPFAVADGIRDVLATSGGHTWRVTNFQIFHAARMFRETEGVDIGPAAAVATDALRQAVEAGAIGSEECVLLHITGGGREIQYSTLAVKEVRPTTVVAAGDVAAAVKAIGALGKIGSATISEKLGGYTP